ncbi:MAG: hypothetical protein O3A96_09810 [Proteobacteria bacterium]|nr:hypothetical protein [Pseudomonadota bacterium]
MRETDVLKLQTIHPFDFITLQVLERWNCGRDETGMWSCWRDGEDEAGTLWIDFSAIPLAEGTSERKALMIAALQTGNFGLLAGHGKDGSERIWRYTDESEEEGEAITLFRWHLYTIFPLALVIVHYSLVFSTSEVEDRLTKQIYGQMDDQISRTAIRFDSDAIQRHGYVRDNGNYTGRLPSD